MPKSIWPNLNDNGTVACSLLRLFGLRNAMRPKGEFHLAAGLLSDCE